MKDFFKFDDLRINFILFIIIDIMISLLSIYCILQKEYKILLIIGLILMLLIVITVLIYNEGIHFNYKKEKIVIIQGPSVTTIDMNDVKYFTLEEIKKSRKNILLHPIYDTYDQSNIPSKYVYKNGKVFNIIFYTKKMGIIKIYYGRLYKAKSIVRVNNQIKCFNVIKERFMKYKNY